MALQMDESVLVVHVHILLSVRSRTFNRKSQWGDELHQGPCMDTYNPGDPHYSLADFASLSESSKTAVT